MSSQKGTPPQPDQPMPSNIFVKNAIYGGVGLGISPAINFLDLVKTQAQQPNAARSPVIAMFQKGGPECLLNGLRFTATAEMFKLFYRGNLLKGTGNPFDILTASIIDTAVQSIFEKMKTESYTSGKTPSVLKILADPSKRSCLMSGWAPLLVRQSILFGVIDGAVGLRVTLSEHMSSTSALVTSSLFTGFIASVLNNPFDIAKSRQQSCIGDARSFPRIIHDIYQEEGLGYLLKTGMKFRVANNAVTIGSVLIAQSAYEAWQEWEQGKQEQQSILHVQTPEPKQQTPITQNEPNKSGWFSSVKNWFFENQQPQKPTVVIPASPCEVTPTKKESQQNKAPQDKAPEVKKTQPSVDKKQEESWSVRVKAPDGSKVEVTVTAHELKQETTEPVIVDGIKAKPVVPSIVEKGPRKPGATVTPKKSEDMPQKSEGGRGV